MRDAPASPARLRKVHVDCRATHRAKSATTSTTCAATAKAGAIRWLGVRPTVRGVAMNPVDHPHGGGEGKVRPGQSTPGQSPWGWQTQGQEDASQQAHRTA